LIEIINVQELFMRYNYFMMIILFHIEYQYAQSAHYKTNSCSTTRKHLVITIAHMGTWQS